MPERILVLTLLLLAVPCRAEIIIVDDDGPADFNNIQAAIDDSNDGDTIYVQTGVYTGPGNRDIDFLGKPITVRSTDPNDPNVVAATIIDCDANASEPNRAFIFQSGEAGNSVLAGFTITNGYKNYGGAIYCIGICRPTITCCVITGNTATDAGGGIYCGTGSSPIITNCVITGNRASVRGGGISYGGSALNINISDCTFIGNSASTDAGAIRGSAAITNCTFMWNTADNGGALADCTVPIRNCIFIANSASGVGGALHNCTTEISNCVLSCNWAAGNGGAINDVYSDVKNCTFTSNSAGGYGGGIFTDYGVITNCILWRNTDSSGGTGESSQIYGGWPYVTFSCIQDEDPNDADIPFGGEDNGNIDDNPMFVREPNDGGDGWGVGDNDDFGDLHLQNSSPSINAGHPYLSYGPDDVDMDGQPRVIGGRVDIGADEFFTQMLAVTKPEGGEVWAGGSTHQTKWISYGVGGTIDILFSSNNGEEWETIEDNVVNIGSYVWNLPNAVDSNECLVSIVPSGPDPNVVCINSGLFTIHPDFLHPEVPSKWKSLGGDFKRTGLSQNYGPQLGCVKWQFETEGAVSASVTVGAGDRVHIACEDGKVYTLDIDDGSLLWSYDTNSPLLSAPTVGPRGSVYVGSENGKLYAISIGGTLRWTHSTGGLIYSSPAVSEDGNIYVGSQDGTLYALGQDGSELWTFKIAGSGIIEGSILASPAIAADGTIYIGGLYDPNLYALDPNNGSVKWVCNFASGGWPFASPVVAEDGTIYQTLLHDPNLYAIKPNEPNAGTIIWSAHLSKINFWDDFSYSEWFEPYYYEWGRCMHPFLPFMYEGALYHLGDSGWSEPALGPDGTIYVSLEDPYLRAVEPNGTIKWISKPGARSDYTETCGDFGCGWYEKSPGAMGGFTLTVGSDGLIYAGCDDGNLYVVDANGWDVARFDSNNHWLSFPVISADNIVMVSDSRDNSMLISHPNNVVWAIGGDCEGQDLDLYWQGGAQDLDNNGVVDFNDLHILAGDWLKCTDCSNFACVWPFGVERMYFIGDINRDKYVDFVDFALLAERWLGGY